MGVKSPLQENDGRVLGTIEGSTLVEGSTLPRQ
jgi:hypothetical protein